MNIYLVRHGEDEDNAAGLLNGRRDTPLTGRGKGQARAIARKLRNELQGADMIYSSPLQRAQQTAEIIAKDFGLNVVIEESLIERDYGILTGKARTDIPKYSTNNIEVNGLLYFLDVENTESFTDTYARAQTLLDSITKEKYNDIIMVAHRDICIMIQAAFYDWTWEEGIRKAQMKNGSVLKLSD